jgi:hypothetical protein
MENRQKLDRQLPNEVSQLGSPLAEYRRSHVLLFTPLFLLIGGGVMAYIFVTGQAKDWELWQMVVGLAIAVGALVGGISGIRKFMRERDIRVLVFSEGVAEINGTQTSMIRWDEIKTVTISHTQDLSIQSFLNLFGRTLEFAVELNNGTIRTFTQEIEDHKKLGETIVQETTKRLLPNAIEAFDKGRAVTVGKFSVSQQGFVEGNKTIPWSEVKGVTIRGGDSAFLDGTTKIIPAQTPNFAVLLELIGHALKNRSTEESQVSSTTTQVQAPTPAPQEDQTLQKLEEMLDAGLITEQEYEAKKADILSKRKATQHL